MARVKIKLADNIARIVFVETNATIGSTLGVDFKLPDGSIATVASLASLLGVGGTTETLDHRLLAGLTVGDDHPQYTRKDTLTTRGDFYVRGASTVQRFGIGTANQVLRTDGTDPVWHTFSPVITLGTDLSGSATLTDLGSATLNSTIVANAVTDSKLRQSAGLSVIGRSANTTGNVADISAATDGDVLRRSGTAIGFGNIGANPSVSIGLTAKNGTANTYLRSDAAPALDVSITPTWTATHTFNNTPVVPNDSWAYAKIQNVSATSRILGRITAGAGDIEELTGTQTTTLLDVFTSGLQGVVPASGGGTTNFLRADGTFAVPPGTGGGGTPANPTASVGLTAVNGIATTYMRSDAAPALSVAIAPTWTGAHIFSPASGVGVTINAAAGVSGLIVKGSSSGGVATFTGFDAAHSLVTFINNVTTLGRLGDRSAISGGASGSFTVSSQGSFVACTGGTTERFVIDGFGVTLINAPSAGIALTVTSVSTSTAIAMGDGAVATPGLSFIGDPDSGLYRIGANNLGMGVNGAKVLDISTTGLGITGTMVASGAISGSNLSSSGGANPSASLGLSAVNGSAITYMRSDAAPALSVSISPTWTGNHTFSPASGTAVTINGAGGSNVLKFNGVAATPTQAIAIGGTTTAFNYSQISNTGNTTWLGIEGTPGAQLLGGTAAYSTLLATITASDLHLGSNSAVRLTITSGGLISALVPIVLTNYTVSGLPSAATVGAGATAFVTDATLGIAAGLGLTPIGGGSNKVPVYSDGSAWKIG